MKSIWQGQISFGLVSIPVKLYSAVEAKSMKFKLVHEKDNSPIKYKKYCEEEDREIPWEEIRKAVEVSKGNFITLTEDELKRLKPLKSDFIEIVEFVKQEQVDPIYFNKHYFIMPSRAKDKAYFLFKKVLQDSGMTAVGRIIMRDKEYTCIITSYKKGMLITTLNYAYEIRDINKVEELKEQPTLQEAEIKLAKQLIDQLTEEEFEISKFKDTFEEQLIELINHKEEIPIKSKPKTAKSRNLIEELKASLK